MFPQHAEHRYQKYRLVNIFGEPGSPLRQRIIEFWVDSGTLRRDEAERRGNEIVYVVLDPDGNPAGVSTVYTDSFRSPADCYYYYRMYIVPAHRIHGMMLFITSLTRDFLRDNNDSAARRMDGMVIVTENPKLMRSGIKQRIRKIGFQIAGRNARGQDIWVSEFQATQRT